MCQRSACRIVLGSRSGPCQCPRFGNQPGKGVQVAPQEHVQIRAREQLVDVPVPQIMAGDSVQPVPLERIQERTVCPMSLLVVPLTKEKSSEVIQPVLLERIQERTVDPTSHSVVPLTTEQISEVIQAVLLGRIQERILDLSSPWYHRSRRKSWIQNRTRKLFVDVPVLHITEKIVDNVFGLPQERVQNRVTRTGKVFTVRHHRGDQSCAVDTLGLNIKGLDKYNVPRP